jgi:SAM-dependent methyltransferase
MLLKIPCNICQSTDMLQIYEKGNLPISQCANCGLVQANPRLPQEEIWKRYSPTYFWDEYMPAHSAPNGEYHEAFHRHRNMPLLNLLRPFKQQGTLLEVGCAAGFMLKVAEAEGWQVKGLELMESAVQYANETLGIEVIEGTLDDANLAESSFDAIALIETVEHLLDPMAVLQKAHTLLRPGGALLVAVPNQNSLMHKWYGIDWSVLSPAEHLYYFTDDSMEKLLKKIGYSKTEFVWKLPGQAAIEILNPHNTNKSTHWRARATRLAMPFIGPLIYPIVTRTAQADRLIVLAVK